MTSHVKPGIEPDLLHEPLRIQAGNPKRVFTCDVCGQWSYRRACDDEALRYVGDGDNLPAYLRRRLVWRFGIAELKQPRRKS